MKLRSGRKTEQHPHLDDFRPNPPSTATSLPRRRSPRMHTSPSRTAPTRNPKGNTTNFPIPFDGPQRPIPASPAQEDQVVLVPQSSPRTATITPRRSPRHRENASRRNNNNKAPSAAIMDDNNDDDDDDEVVFVRETNVGRPPRRSPRHAMASGVSKPPTRRSGRIPSATNQPTRRRGRRRLVITSPVSRGRNIINNNHNATRARRRRAGAPSAPPNGSRTIARLASRREPLRLPMPQSDTDIDIDIDDFSPVGSSSSATLSTREASSSPDSSSQTLIDWRRWRPSEGSGSSSRASPASDSTRSAPSSTRVLRSKANPTKKGAATSFTCGVCFDDHPIKEGEILCAMCPERFCSGCMGRFLKLATENRQYPLKCPGCMSAMDAWKCVSVLHSSQPDTADALTTLILEREHVETLKYCSNKRCSTPFDFDGTPTGSGARVECPLCLTNTCVRCGSEWHEGKSCAQVAADAPLAQLAQTLQWRHCPTCNQLVEKIDGCVHIVCRCGSEFCYSCGALYNQGIPTCTCVVDDDDTDDEENEVFEGMGLEEYNTMFNQRPTRPVNNNNRPSRIQLTSQALMSSDDDNDSMLEEDSDSMPEEDSDSMTGDYRPVESANPSHNSNINNNNNNNTSNQAPVFVESSSSDEEDYGLN